MNFAARLKRQTLSIIAALSLLGSISFAAFPIGGGGPVDNEDSGNDETPKKGCESEYENLDLQMDVLEAVEAMLSDCLADQAASTAQRDALLAQIANLQAQLASLADEQRKAQAKIANCQDELGPAFEEAKSTALQETQVTEDAMDAALLDCLGFAAGGAGSLPNAWDIATCIMSYLNLSSSADALVSAIAAYVNARNALEGCKGPHEDRLEEIASEFGVLGASLGSAQLALSELQVPDCSTLDSAHEAAKREVKRSQDRLEACLNPDRA